MSESPFAPLELPPPGSRPVWWPLNEAQQAAINSPADLLLYGGASGGGKTQFLVADGAQERANPALRGLMIRKTLTEMQEINDVMHRIYTPMRARWKGRINAWEFPSGATIRPGYLRKDRDIDRYQGNPITWLGVDESGQHPENRVRLMVAWLVAPEYTRLRSRARFTCNPGGEGYAWEMQVFLRYRCPIHFPAGREDKRPRETSTYPGKVYKGAKWTDGGSVAKTTCFIPAFLKDNPLYYKTKFQSLMSQTAAVRKQLLDGCWCNAEGIYFDCLQPSMVTPLAMVGEEWWWNHFVSIDYGFGNSSAAAGLYAVSPAGRVFKVRERDEPKMGSVEFVTRLCEKGFAATNRAPAQASWLHKLRERDPERPRINFCVIDSANDQHTGTGKSNFELMAEVLAKYGIPCIKAAKDAMGNAQNLYNGLGESAIVLTSAVPRTYKSLTSRTIDERRAVKKIHGDPLDDIYDETSYAYNTFLDQSLEPAKVGLERQIEEMRKRGLDENSIEHYRWRREIEIEQAQRAAARGIPLTGQRINDVVGR